MRVVRRQSRAEAGWCPPLPTAAHCCQATERDGGGGLGGTSSGAPDFLSSLAFSGRALAAIGKHKECFG